MHRIPARRGSSAGFSLIELMVTIAVFLVLGVAATRLASICVGISTGQQTQSALNVGIRNVAAQMEIDATNAGTGYFPTYNIPGAPIGITIASGYTNDTLTIVSFDPINVAHPTVSADTTSGSMTITPVGITASALGAAYVPNVDEIMMFSNTVNASTGQPYVTTFPLTAVSAGSSTVTLTFTKNTAVSSGATWASDPLTISSSNTSGNLQTSFDNTDWVLRTQTIVYYMDTVNNRLMRQVNSGTPEAIASNILSFKVGAQLYTSSTPVYTYGIGAIPDFRQVRSIRVSLIGKTNVNPMSPFRNTYDGGQYRIEGSSFIINPRNLSLHD